MAQVKIIDIDDRVYIELLISYLGELQEGRIKPNSKSSSSTDSTVRDSIDNFGDILGVKKRLNEIFELDIEFINNKNKNRSNG